jgi:hypothetical protein
MDDALDDIAKLLDQTEEDLIGEIVQLEPEVYDVPVQPLQREIEAVEFDDTTNLVDPVKRAEFINERVFEETDILSAPTITTITTEGFLSNVKFREADQIDKMIPNEHIVLIKCNYGTKKHESYVEPVIVKKSNRGRKKKEKKKKTRKNQGAGDSFNSQVSFMMPCNGGFIKPKIFRTGRLQIPGVTRPELIEEVIQKTRYLAQYMDVVLNPDVLDPTLQTRLISINPVMKNYKLHIKLPPDHIIDLTRLVSILREIQRKNLSPIRIFTIKYRRSATRVSVKFDTPVYKNSQKKVHINIFMGGKINILGGLLSGHTRSVCAFFDDLLRTYRDVLMVQVQTHQEEVYNIAETTDMIEYLAGTCLLSDEDAQLIADYVENTYAALLREFLDYLHSL